MFKRLILLTSLFIGVTSGTVFSDSTDVRSVKADQYMQRGNYPLALNLYLSLVRSAPHEAFLNNRVGYIYYKMLKYSDALPFLLKATILNPTNASFWNNRAICYFRTGDITAATTAYNNAIRFRPDDPKYPYNLAVLYFYQRNYKKSLDMLLTSYQLNRKYVRQRPDKKRYLSEFRRMREKYPEDKELLSLKTRWEELNR